jgi:uncharacterized membrane protein
MNNLEPSKNLPSTDKTKVLNLDMNVAECLCYVPIAAIGLIASVLWLASEPKSNYQIRFHAVQSLVLGGAFFAVAVVFSIGMMILGFIPFIGPILGMVSGLVFWVLSLAVGALYVYLAIQAFQRNTIKLPYVSDVVENLIK